MTSWCAALRWGRIYCGASGELHGFAAGVSGARSDRFGKAGGEAIAGDVDADIDREYGGDGKRGGFAAGGSGRDCCGAERDWRRGLFGYGALVWGGGRQLR